MLYQFRPRLPEDPWLAFLHDLRLQCDRCPGLNAEAMDAVLHSLLQRHPKINRIKFFIGKGEHHACKNYFSHRDRYIYFYYHVVPSSMTGHGVES